MKRLWFELVESFRIARTQIQANKMRSALTALGVIIGIIAVTLMGTAIKGIDRGFDKSMSLLGDDVLYVTKFPWGPGDDFWLYRNRPRIKPEFATELNRIIAGTYPTDLLLAVPTLTTFTTVIYQDRQLQEVYTMGTTSEFTETTEVGCREGRFLTEVESRGAANVCVIGLDVSEALFPSETPLGKMVQIKGQRFRVVGVIERQGSFLGLFSFDSQIIVPLGAFEKYFTADEDAAIRVKVKSKEKMVAAKQELIGAMRRIRGLMPDQRETFSVNEQEAIRSTIAPIKTGIAVAGLFITGLALFVGAIGIMNITFVSVKERTREIGTRKALGARRRTILFQFLIEAVSICLLGGAVGLFISYLLFLALSAAVPAFPIQFSTSLMLTALLVSIATGVISGFAPAWAASKLNPVEALRYE